MPEMELGVLSEMPGIRHKACEKLALQQVFSCTVLNMHMI